MKEFQQIVSPHDGSVGSFQADKLTGGTECIHQSAGNRRCTSRPDSSWNGRMSRFGRVRPDQFAAGNFIARHQLFRTALFHRYRKTIDGGKCRPACSNRLLPQFSRRGHLPVSCEGDLVDAACAMWAEELREIIAGCGPPDRRRPRNRPALRGSASHPLVSPIGAERSGRVHH